MGKVNLHFDTSSLVINILMAILGCFSDFFLLYLLQTELLPLNKLIMDALVERIVKAENFTEEEATKKLNLIYVKMNGASISSFVDEYTEWLMDVKKMNFKSILKMTDLELHDIYVNEYKE
jgi:hypothetical protein